MIDIEVLWVEVEQLGSLNLAVWILTLSGVRMFTYLFVFQLPKHMVYFCFKLYNLVPCLGRE